MDRVRWEMVRRIRREIAEGSYVTQEKLEQAAERLAEDIFQNTDRSRPAGCLFHGTDLDPACPSCGVFRQVLDRSTAQGSDQDDS